MVCSLLNPKYVIGVPDAILANQITALLIVTTTWKFLGGSGRPRGGEGEKRKEEREV